jgi:ribosomal protein S18 acetylase RimI-like enzyme
MHYSCKKVALIGFLVLTGFGAIFFINWEKDSTHIVEFKYSEHGAFVNRVFEENRYWLLGEGLEDYSLDHLLIKRVSNITPDQYALEDIKIMLHNGTPVGFVTYSKTKFWQGKVRLLGVDEKYRGKGYGQELLNYAVKDLISQGCTNIFLVTRTTNYPAQKIYRKVGFKETGESDGFVRFDYYV